MEESSLSAFDDATAQAWKERFGVPYSICGCAPEPLPSTISKFTSKIFKSPEVSGSTITSNPRPDLVSTEAKDDAVDATHPSEHNSISIAGDAQSRGRKAHRARKIKEYVEAIGKAKVKREGKGKTATWSEIQLRNRENGRANHQEAYSSAYSWPELWPYSYFGSIIHFRSFSNTHHFLTEHRVRVPRIMAG